MLKYLQLLAHCTRLVEISTEDRFPFLFPLPKKRKIYLFYCIFCGVFVFTDSVTHIAVVFSFLVLYQCKKYRNARKQDFF